MVAGDSLFAAKQKKDGRCPFYLALFTDPGHAAITWGLQKEKSDETKEKTRRRFAMRVLFLFSFGVPLFFFLGVSLSAFYAAWEKRKRRNGTEILAWHWRGGWANVVSPFCRGKKRRQSFAVFVAFAAALLSRERRHDRTKQPDQTNRKRRFAYKKKEKRDVKTGKKEEKRHLSWRTVFLEKMCWQRA